MTKIIQFAIKSQRILTSDNFVGRCDLMQLKLNNYLIIFYKSPKVIGYSVDKKAHNTKVQNCSISIEAIDRKYKEKNKICTLVIILVYV